MRILRGQQINVSDREEILHYCDKVALEVSQTGKMLEVALSFNLFIDCAELMENKIAEVLLIESRGLEGRNVYL